MFQIVENLLLFEWLSISLCISLFGLLTLYMTNAPQFLHRVFKYGKTIDHNTDGNKHSVKQSKQIPKRWFFHFYLFAAIFYFVLIFIVFNVYFFRTKVPKSVSFLLNVFCGRHRNASVSEHSVCLAFLLIAVQVTRRLYECTRLSIYSPDGKMALVHYLCGFSFYFGVGLTLLAEAPAFSQQSVRTHTTLQMQGFVSWAHVWGVCLFVVSSLIQFKSHAILAQLRKDASGRVVTLCHSIPRGHLFELISCPHYFAEILIYLSISVCLSGQSIIWWFVFFFVFTNQVIVGLFNHKWYQKSFQNYPKRRKAIIPFLL